MHVCVYMRSTILTSQFECVSVCVRVCKYMRYVPISFITSLFHPKPNVLFSRQDSSLAFMWFFFVMLFQILSYALNGIGVPKLGAWYVSLIPRLISLDFRLIGGDKPGMWIATNCYCKPSKVWFWDFRGNLKALCG